VLQQAATVTATAEGSYELFDYVISLREGIMDAWGGIIGAMKSSGKSKYFCLDNKSFVADLSVSSPSSSTVCAGDFPTPQHGCYRLESERGVDAGFYGCYWVSEAAPWWLPQPPANIHSDLADAYPNGEIVDAFRQDWVTGLIKETRTNRDFQSRTIETARWAREQVKRQLGGTQNVMLQS